MRRPFPMDRTASDILLPEIHLLVSRGVYGRIKFQIFSHELRVAGNSIPDGEAASWNA